jgi:hypothetical protein
MEAQRRVWWVRRDDLLFFLSPTLFMLSFWLETLLRMEETKTKHVFVTERPRNCIPRVLHTTVRSTTTRPFSGRVR